MYVCMYVSHNGSNMYMHRYYDNDNQPQLFALCTERS